MLLLLSQEERLSFVSETGGVVDRAQNLPAGAIDVGLPHSAEFVMFCRGSWFASFVLGSRVLIVDDFTNSGSTLFGGANIVRKRCQGIPFVCMFLACFIFITRLA